MASDQIRTLKLQPRIANGWLRSLKLTPVGISVRREQRCASSVELTMKEAAADALVTHSTRSFDSLDYPLTIWEFRSSWYLLLRRP